MHSVQAKLREGQGGKDTIDSLESSKKTRMGRTDRGWGTLTSLTMRSLDRFALTPSLASTDNL